MSDGKVPAVVTFITFGRRIPAIVLSARSSEPSHLGANGEPLLTIAFKDPARETGLTKDANGEYIYPIGREPQVFIERDVVHESHEFDEEFLKKHGDLPAQIASQRGNGEWTEFASEAPAPAKPADPAPAPAPVLVPAPEPSEPAASEPAPSEPAGPTDPAV